MDSLFHTLCLSAGVSNVSAVAMGYGRNQGRVHNSWGRWVEIGQERQGAAFKYWYEGKHLVKQGFKQGQVNVLFASA